MGQRLLWRLQALLMSLFWWASGVMGPDRASAAGGALLRLIGPRLPRSAKIERNLRHVFPEAKASEIAAMVGEVWGNFGAVLAEYPHIDTIYRGQTGGRPRIEFVVAGNIRALAEEGTPAVFVTAHVGNWELGALCGVHFGVPVSVVHKAQRNPWVRRLLQRHRQALDCGFVDKEAGARPLLRLLQQGISVGLLPDQKVNGGAPVPFFGQDAQTTTLPARLAIKVGCELVPMRVERLAGARFRITLHAPIVADGKDADPHHQALAMTRRLNAVFESWIRPRPTQWWCPKNRWPTKKSNAPE